MITVAILEDIHNAMIDYPSVQRLRERVNLRVHTRAMTPDERPGLLKGTETVVCLRERTRIDAAFLDDAPDLKLVIQTGRVGPNLDMNAITKRGVLVATAAPAPHGPGAGGPNSTVELTIGLIIAIMRRIPQSDALMRRGQWVVLPYGRSLAGKTLGVIGPGRIGSWVAKIGAMFGMEVLTWSRNNTPERAASMGAKAAASLDDLMRESDVVTVHLPLNESTRNLVSAEKLDLLKPTAYFVNTSRGPIADEDHLVTILHSRRIAGAALDVYNREPLPAGHPLLALDNVVLTPHIGWPADSGYSGFADATAKVVEAYLDGKLEPVNPEARAASR